MNILLFTHGIDIDGMGSAVLAGLFAQNLEVQFCETEDIDTKFEEVVLKKNKINWDYIFIADTCPSIDILKRIEHDLTLKEKVFVFDHHKNQIAQGKNKFSFVTLQFENEKGLCCGTSLFYQFLIENKLLLSYPSLDLFVEYTRQYDTWEWWDKYHNEIPHELTILYDCIGNDDYISEMKEMLLQQKDVFVLSDFCKKIIYYEKKKIENICQEKINSIIPVSINGISCGIIVSEQYINEF